MGGTNIGSPDRTGCGKRRKPSQHAASSTTQFEYLVAWLGCPAGGCKQGQHLVGIMLTRFEVGLGGGPILRPERGGWNRQILGWANRQHWWYSGHSIGVVLRL